MPLLLQINVTANWGSTGKIAEEIGKIAINNGWDSYIAYGRGNPVSASKLIPIGTKLNMYMHGVESRLFDNHGLSSKNATRKLISEIERINPDIIHLHNIHGYFINYEILFDYLSQANVPVVWTLHDCWSFTGHCAYFDLAGCDAWKTGCIDCKHKSLYPKSLLLSNSADNYSRKKQSFTSLNKLTLVPVSQWLSELLSESFLSQVDKKTIHNGIDTQIFYPCKQKSGVGGRFMVLGVASVWEERKGLKDFVALREKLPMEQFEIVLIGLNDEQIKFLPSGIRGISRTNSVSELAEYYSAADVFVNPTWEDNFPTTNLEALACGTPVVTYRTGGSVEAVDAVTGRIVEKGDVQTLSECIKELCHSNDKEKVSTLCRERAERLYNKNDKFKEYMDLYKCLLEDKHMV